MSKGCEVKSDERSERGSYELSHTYFQGESVKRHAMRYKWFAELTVNGVGNIMTRADSYGTVQE